MVITLPANYLRAVHATAAKDGVRFYLHGYLLRRETGGSYTLTATDGHGLTQVPVTVTDDRLPLTFPIIIGRLPRPIRKAAELATFEVTDDRRTLLTLTSKTGKVVDTEVLPEVVGVYPDIDTVIPKEYTDTQPKDFCFNSSLVCRVTEAMGPATMAYYRYTGDGCVFKVEMVKFPEVLALVMPARR